MTNLLPFSEPRSREVTDAITNLATASDSTERGSVYTRPEVVESILDLCGYTVDAQLERKRFLEPSFGNGEFLVAAVRRLCQSLAASGADLSRAGHLLRPCVRAVEIHKESFSEGAERVKVVLLEFGMPECDASRLIGEWLISDDFLLAQVDGQFDVVAGNPPYVRQERIPDALLQTYRRRFLTLYDRADLYVLFYERGLDFLSKDGVLGYICANRWVKNKYGGPLRGKVGSGFELRHYLDLAYADVFDGEVSAYPAITVIGRGSGRRTVAAIDQGCFNDRISQTANLMRLIESGGRVPSNSNLRVLEGVVSGRDPWLFETPELLYALRGLEARLPSLEEAGVVVGIGVATGADKVFIGDYEQLPVEESRRLPLAKAADIVGSQVEWGGLGLINPYLESGDLAPFSEYPRFAQYMKSNSERLKKRHAAKRSPARWYKTIDRVYPALLQEPKLLIPDIKGGTSVAYDPGEFYPHHNLYTVMSKVWDLRALQAILRSSVAMLFVSVYCVRMGGGYLRFQAQYLRRVRLPRWSSLERADIDALRRVADSTDQSKIDSVVLPLYGVAEAQAAAILAYADASRQGVVSHG